jgi:hypothetical protein
VVIQNADFDWADSLRYRRFHVIRQLSQPI